MSRRHLPTQYAQPSRSRVSDARTPALQRIQTSDVDIVSDEGTFCFSSLLVQLRSVLLAQHKFWSNRTVQVETTLG